VIRRGITPANHYLGSCGRIARHHPGYNSRASLFSVYYLIDHQLQHGASTLSVTEEELALDINSPLRKIANSFYEL